MIWIFNGVFILRSHCDRQFEGSIHVSSFSVGFPYMCPAAESWSELCRSQISGHNSAQAVSQVVGRPIHNSACTSWDTDTPTPPTTRWKRSVCLQFHRLKQTWAEMCKLETIRYHFFIVPIPIPEYWSDISVFLCISPCGLYHFVCNVAQNNMNVGRSTSTASEPTKLVSLQHLM